MDGNINKQVENGHVEWLVDKLIATEEELNNALECLREAKLENISLRSKLNMVNFIFRNENGENDENDLDVSDNGNIDISELLGGL